MTKSDFSNLSLRRRSEGVDMRQMGDTVFLANSVDDEIYYLNEIGAAIWNLLGEPRNQQEVIEILHMAFPDLELDTIKSDVRRLFEELDTLGLTSPV